MALEVARSPPTSSIQKELDKNMQNKQYSETALTSLSLNEDGLHPYIGKYSS